MSEGSKIQVGWIFYNYSLYLGGWAIQPPPLFAKINQCDIPAGENNNIKFTGLKKYIYNDNIFSCHTQHFREVWWLKDGSVSKKT